MIAKFLTHDENGPIKRQDLLLIVAVSLASVSFSISAAYFSFAYLFAVLLALASAALMFLRPEWFLYLAAALKVSLDAVKIVSFSAPEAGKRWAFSLDGTLTALFIAMCALILLRRKNLKLLSLPGAKAYGLFIFLCLFSLFFSQDPVFGARRLVKYAAYFIIYFLCVNLLDTQKKSRLMIIALFLSALVPLSFGFYQAVTSSGSITAGGFNRIFATLTYPNAYAFYLMIMLIFTSGAYLGSRGTPIRLALLLYAALLFVSLILTFTRGAWFGLILAWSVLAVLVLRKSGFKNFPALIFLFGVSSLLAIMFAPWIVQRSVYLTGASMGSFGWRSTLWLTYFNQFLLHPFKGSGLGSSSAIAKKELGFIIAPHNDYLKILVESGVFALAAYIAFLFSVFSSGVKKFMSTALDSPFIYAALAAAVVSVSFVFLGDNLLDYDASFSYFWFFLGAVYSLHNIK
ncbi:MAG: O-antigen ligase family protein [Candidatus Omnitrophica bacterium]|nr:O-antigen ligase family protein [Candidatus Omnitrophota bacterium]